MDLILPFLRAFVCGGVLCAAAQILLDKTKLTPARILVGYVVVGVILGASGIYDKFADFAGAGATVPLTGFGNQIARGVRRAVAERGLAGVLTGSLSAASGGTTAALLFGTLAAVFFRSKPKR